MRTSLISIVASILMTFAVTACGDDDGNTGDDVDEADAAPTPDCATYCTAVMANCTDEFAQYSTMDVCMATCAAFPTGTGADTSGNTLGCRIYHANNVETTSMPALHCPHAGPGGGGACGTNCEGFCSIAAHACTGDADPFDDAADCAATCAAFDAEEAFDTSDTTGDTLACRLYHVSVASMTPDPHCTHIDTDSAPCSDAP